MTEPIDTTEPSKVTPEVMALFVKYKLCGGSLQLAQITRLYTNDHDRRGALNILLAYRKARKENQ